MSLRLADYHVALEEEASSGGRQTRCNRTPIDEALFEAIDRGGETGALML